MRKYVGVTPESLTMSTNRLNDKILAFIAFVSGVLTVCFLFRLGILSSCAGCSIDVNGIMMNRYVQCKSTYLVENEQKLRLLLSPLLGSQTDATDTRLVSAIRDHFIDYPGLSPTKFSQPPSPTMQANELDNLLHKKTGGFFVECGGLDGETSSNTIWLENKRGWNGLLIEMDPSYYMQIRGKNRNSLSINACLSPYQYPTKMDFKEHHMGQGRLVTNEKTRTEDNEPIIHTTYCFPFHTIMLALNRTKIDYFSLDVEGMELPILRTIPFDLIDISVVNVEYNHGAEGSRAYVDFMESKGYRMHMKLDFLKRRSLYGGNDYVFVKKDLRV